MLLFRDMALVLSDIDGPLTDGTMWWAGEAGGWVQRFDVRDTEALRRLKDSFPVVPLTRNATDHARRYIEDFGLDVRWLGIDDPMKALEEVCL